MEKFEDNLTFEDIINQTLKKVKVGSTITGTIVEINGKGEIFVDIGYKADGIITRNEYFSEKGLEPADEYKVGDKIKADVLKLNDGQGNVLMSCKHAKIKEIRKYEERDIKITFKRVLAYFVIYSFLGFIVETIFGMLTKGVVESRQSCLYGPFCCIYGLGAAVMIPGLEKFKKSNW